MSKIRNLLSFGADAKTSKGEKLGWFTGILYLVPYGQLGLPNLCPKASKGCGQSCLFSAGRGSFSNVIHSRKRKTELFLENREQFLEMLERDIRKALAKYKGALCIRLNGTSDIAWESTGIMDKFPMVPFYDYTKRINRVLNPNRPRNYHLTFSRSESNHAECMEVLKNGGNVAAVFRNELPSEYDGFPVINGDESDLRFLDSDNVIVGLKAKGAAKRDTSGFVIG